MRFRSILTFVFFSLFLISTSVFSSLSIPDTVKVLAIRVEFQEDNASSTTGSGKFDLSQPSGAYQVDPPPHNRLYFEDQLLFLNNYFKKVSHGKLTVSGDVFPSQVEAAYQLDEPMTFYNPNTTPTAINTGLATLLKDALQKADTDPEIDFGRYQSVMVFHAGVGKDVDLGFDETPQDIPSLFLTSDFLQQYLGTPVITVDDSVHIPGGILLPETESQVGVELGLNGIIVSNLGTQLGLPDLFSPVTRRSGIGRFGLMDAGLFNGDGLLPALPCAWTRIYAGWEQAIPVQYASNDEFDIHHVLSGNPDRVYKFPINNDEYYLVENRFAGKLNLDSVRFEMENSRNASVSMREVLLTHFSDQVTFSERGVLTDVDNPDIGLPGSGVLIWHIDENVIRANLAANRINADPEHRGVDLEEADGSQDIGQEFDILSAGSGSETGWIFNNEFSPSSIPNSRSYYNRANSHITLKDFSRPDSVMAFQGSFNFFQQNFPISIDPDEYGRITSVKVSDLDFDEKDELVLTTELGKILVVGKDGKSAWGTDSLMIADLPGHIVKPPVLFTFQESAMPQPQKRLVACTRNGSIYGFSFSGQTASTLFPAIQLNDSITTHPVAIGEGGKTTDVYWGTAKGRVYDFKVYGSELPFDTISYSVDEPIRFLHVNQQGQIVVITESGGIYRDQESLGTIELPYQTPAGPTAAALTRDGNFLRLEDGAGDFAEAGLFRFDSPLIMLDRCYIAAGNNRLYAFNYNFTLVGNFPVKLYVPEKPVNLFLSPLWDYFVDKNLKDSQGIVVVDPAGLIDGFDLQGQQLADFPLAVGDSILTTPALLDIDGDSDTELAVVTKSNRLYVWDFMSEHSTDAWNQLYANEKNSNFQLLVIAVPDSNSQLQYNSDHILPEKKVYNWPNPNTENFTFIRYFLNGQADVHIKIFDLAGDLVDQFRGPNHAFTDNEVKWDLSAVQSGVYLARVEARSSGKSEARIIKIAVIK
jgi:M6 family metalloprotease-like protein